MTAWALLLLAGVLEVIWTLGLKHSDGFTRLWPTLVTVVAIPLSFVLLALSLKTVPFGTAYAVWVGIGAAGVAATGIVLFGESAGVMRIACLCLILIGTIGLKFAAPD
jgi:quaternary ammonium compound-resistance protein SugE